MRSIIVAERCLDVDHLLVSETLTREDTAGREMRQVTRGSSNRGQLNPQALGTPTTDLDLDLIMRSGPSGRFGIKDHTATYYRGKSPAGRLTNFNLIAHTGSLPTRVSRPKLVPLASGQLLLAYLTGTYSNTLFATGVAWRVFVPGTGWSAEQTLSVDIDTSSGIVGVDAVQLETGDLALFVLSGSLATSLSAARATVTRFVSAYDTLATISWIQTFTETPTANFGSPSYIMSLAVEVMANGRLSMLIQNKSAGLLGYFSDNSGESWSTSKVAGGITAAAIATGATSAAYGGVSICRLKNGTLLATAPTVIGAHGVSSGWSLANDDLAMRLLASDDGENWNDMVTASLVADGVSTVTSVASHLLPQGCNEGAVCVGPDGIPKFFGAYHGNAVDKFWDDLVILSLKKSDVTSADVGAGLTGDTAHDIVATASNYVITASNAFDGVWYPTQGALRLTVTEATYGDVLKGVATRTMAFHQGDAASWSNRSNGALIDNSAQYCGLRQLDAVEYRGAIWHVFATEDTGDVSYGLSSAQSAVWTERHETLARNDDYAKFVKGRVYDVGCAVGGLDPVHVGWPFSGTGSAVADTTTHGQKITALAGATAYYSAGAALHGDSRQPAFVTATCLPTDGGDTGSDYIVLGVGLKNGGRLCNIHVRFTATAIYVYDYAASALLGSVTGLTSGKPFEVTLMFHGAAGSGYVLLDRVTYKVVQDLPEAETEGVIISSPMAISAPVDASSEYLQFGTFAVSATDTHSTWRNVHFQRGTEAVATKYAYLNRNTYTSYPAEEFKQSDDNDVPAYDDGVRHGTRPAICTPFPQGLGYMGLVQWRGYNAVPTDTWRLTSNHSSDVTRIVREPVGSLFKAVDDDTDTPIVFDSGITGLYDTFFRPNAIALFGLNAHTFKVQFNATNVWTSPTVSIVCSTTGTPDVKREFYRRTTGVTLEGTDNNILRLTGDSTTPLPFKMMALNGHSGYYVYSSALGASFKIIDSDENRIVVAGDMTGMVLTGGNWLSFYRNRITFDMTGAQGLLTGAGLRYMRILLPAQVTAEGRHQLGYVIAGRKFSFASPHPEWGNHQEVDGKVVVHDGQGGYKARRMVQGASSRSWKWAFSGLLGRDDRVGYTYAPGGVRASWQQFIDLFEALQWGQKVVALLPDYASEETILGQTSDVHAAAMMGPVSLTQQAYEACRTDGSTRAIVDMADIEFAEVL